MLNPEIFRLPLLQVALVVGITILTNSCVDHNLELPIVVECDDFKTVSFSANIEPIITSNCAIQGTGGAECHNGDNGADLDWRVFSNFQEHAKEVKRRVTLPKSDGDHMPRQGSLSLDQIQLIVCWVEQGALNN